MNKKWYTDKVRQYKKWVREQEHDVEFWIKQREFCDAQISQHNIWLAEKEEWLQEAESDLDEYVANKAKH